MGKKKSNVSCGPMDDGDWRAQSDHRTITEAAAIKNDPSRMKGVMRHQVTAAKSLKTVHDDIGEAGVRKTKDYKGVMKTLKGMK